MGCNLIGSDIDEVTAAALNAKERRAAVDVAMGTGHTGTSDGASSSDQVGLGCYSTDMPETKP